MTAVRSFLRSRIARLLVIICMIMGFVVPSVIADYSSDLSVSDQRAYEIHILDIQGMRDCVIEASASERITAPAFVKNAGRAVRSIFAVAAAGMLPDNAALPCRLLNGYSFVRALPGISTLSFILITTTKLKDGDK